MEAPWLPTVLNMLEDIPHSGPILNHLVIDVLVSKVLRSLPSIHLTLWLLRKKMLHIQEFFLSACQAELGLTQASKTKVIKHYWKEWAG